MIIGVLNQKGGVGKTTIATNLTHALALHHQKVLLVDADPQGSALAWSSARQEDPLFPVIGMAKPTLNKDLPAIAEDYDYVVIDGAPRVNMLGRALIAASDFILIPVQPSPYDVWASADVATLIDEAIPFKPALRVGFVINRKIVNTAIGRDVADALSTYKYTVLETPLCQRVIYAESAAQGRTVLELDPNGSATREVRALAVALLRQTEKVAA